MRRQDIQLRTLARQGHDQAKIKLGQLYLVGGDGFAKNIAVGLSYLRDAASEDAIEPALLVASCLRLEEMLEYKQLDMLRIAAEASPEAQVKLGSWLLLTGYHSEAVGMLSRSAYALPVLNAWRESESSLRLRNALCAAALLQPMDVSRVTVAAARSALDRADLGGLLTALSAAYEENRPDPALNELVLEAICIAEKTGAPLGDLQIPQIQHSLEKLVSHGNVRACYLLGRALLGINCSSIPWQRLVDGTNLRKGSALLLRAADAGESAAWLYLYQISSDYRCSVANPQMARFCLEKAAAYDVSEAQRRLGAIQMRDAETLEEVEKAVELLFRASSKGDGHAQALLCSLVLPLPGSDEEAEAVVSEVQRLDPWLAARLRLARNFGLTKAEALSVNPAQGLRPWGLVVGQNPFIAQVRMSAPRAIPAVTPDALAALRQAASFFGNEHQDHASIEGNLRKRSLNQRRLFERLHAKEALFFSTASSSERDALRIGSRWAHRSKAALQSALSDQIA